MTKQCRCRGESKEEGPRRDNTEAVRTSRGREENKIIEGRAVKLESKVSGVGGGGLFAPGTLPCVIGSVN